MAGQGNARSRLPVSWSDRQIRQHGAGALRHAMTKALATQRDVAKWIRRSERNVRDVLAGRATLPIEVLRSGRLRREVLRYLQVCDRRVRVTLPHVARKRRHR